MHRYEDLKNILKTEKRLVTVTRNNREAGRLRNQWISVETIQTKIGQNSEKRRKLEETSYHSDFSERPLWYGDDDNNNNTHNDNNNNNLFAHSYMA